MRHLSNEAIAILIAECEVDMPTRGDQLESIQNLVHISCDLAIQALVRNVTAVQRTSDQSVTLVFTSCHQASLFEQAVEKAIQ